MCLKLAAAVEEQECLWNVLCETYKDRNLREIAWESVSKTIHFSKENTKEKWRLQRQQFRVSGHFNIILYLFIYLYYIIFSYFRMR